LGINPCQKSRFGIAQGNAGSDFPIPPTIERQIKHPKILIAKRLGPQLPAAMAPPFSIINFPFSIPHPTILTVQMLIFAARIRKSTLVHNHLVLFKA